MRSYTDRAAFSWTWEAVWKPDHDDLYMAHVYFWVPFGKKTVFLLFSNKFVSRFPYAEQFSVGWFRRLWQNLSVLLTTEDHCNMLTDQPDLWGSGWGPSVCPPWTPPEDLLGHSEVPSLAVGQAGEQQSLTEMPSHTGQDRKKWNNQGLGQHRAVFWVLRNTPLKILQSKITLTLTSLCLNTSWRGCNWWIEGTSSPNNSARGREWKIMAMGTAASLPKIFAGTPAAGKVP